MNKLSVKQRQNLTGWAFLTPAVILLIVLNFVPLIQAFFLSLQTGRGSAMEFTGFSNYVRMFRDPNFLQTVKTTLLYMIVTVPVMIILGIVLAVLLNDPQLKLKGIYRTCIFLPAAVSLVASAIIFRSLFAMDGFVNSILLKFGIIQTSFNFLGHPDSAKVILIIMRIWRWVGYQMIFFLAGLQNIDDSLYEAARIDGATSFQCFRKITLPLLKPMVVFTTVMCLNSALQVYDESVNLTGGGPGTSTMALAHYIYNTSFVNVPNFGYSCAMSMMILIFVAVMTFIQMKAGDARE
ncbi:MAG: sugar ABC transporter permease [Blautia sp.]|nr:sugar ABC transporter permease [Lachnoclostridium sp.]MCM1212214.1 sugar ABC transporter permease [Blautia sp.]